MEKQTGSGLLLALLLLLLAAALNAAVADKVDFKAGGEVTLQLRPPFSGTISNILWKHRGNLLAEWVKGKVPLTYYGSFGENGRTTLNTDTARLQITDMRPTDAGLFTVEINSQVQDQSFDAKLLRGVPRPRIWVQPVACTGASDRCTLSCEGDTTDAEPVAYSWKEGGGEWKRSGKDLDIFRNETAQVETFSCRMTNPVSENTSEPELNPFLKKAEGADSVNAGAIVGGIFLVVVVFALGGVAFWKRGPIKDCVSERLGGSNPDPVAGTDPAVKPNKSPEAEHLDPDGDNSNAK